jgi:anaerobic magnesium-protoporphyrin IX monomethyl ester cyclase
VAGFGPDLVGMAAMTHEICRAADIAKRLKRDLSVPVVVGGCQVTALPRRTLSEFPSFDYGINGEGERALLALAQRLSSGSADVHDIESLVFREGNEITINARPPFLTSEDLDGLPFPSFDDYYGDDRQALKARDACCVLTTSRGCPYNCAFCMQVLGRKVRRRSPENIIREMERAINRWGAHTFDFYDDILLYDGPETRRLLEIMIEKGFPRTVRWCGVTRANLVNPDLMALARKAGCFRLGLGVESGDDEILKIIGKGITVDQVRKAVRIIKDAGIAVDAYFILGHPNETEEQVKKTVDLAAELNPDTIAVGLMVPYPGTRINEMALRGAGGYRLLSEDWSQYDKYGGKTLELSGLPYHKLIRWQRRALINLYLRNLRPLGLIRYLWRRRSALSFFMKRRLGIRIVSRE